MPRSSQTWNRGRTGNPDGRPKGRSTRRELSESFLRVVRSRWEKHGASIIDKMVKEEPFLFAKLVHQLLPKNYRIELDEPCAPLLVIEEPKVAVEHKGQCAVIDAEPTVAKLPKLPH